MFKTVCHVQVEYSTWKRKKSRIKIVLPSAARFQYSIVSSACVISSSLFTFLICDYTSLKAKKRSRIYTKKKNWLSLSLILCKTSSILLKRIGNVFCWFVCSAHQRYTRRKRKKPIFDLYFYYLHFVSRYADCTGDDSQLRGLQESCQSTESVHSVEWNGQHWPLLA